MSQTPVGGTDKHTQTDRHTHQYHDCAWPRGRAGWKTSCSKITLNSSESIWPPPFSTGVYRNEEPSPEGQRDKEIPLSQFMSSLFEGVGQLLPGDFAGLLMCRPRLLAAGDSCCQKVLQRFSGSIQGEIQIQIHPSQRGPSYLDALLKVCSVPTIVNLFLEHRDIV